MTLTQLKYILAVADKLSFIKAAEDCNVAQPSLSAQVKKLEEDLGVLIFDRGKSGVRVTEAGEKILAQARLITDETERLYEIKNDHLGKVQGELKLGIIPTIAPYLISSFLTVLRHKYPELRISIWEATTDSLINELEIGKIDAAILSTPEKASINLMERFLYYEPFVLFAHPKHELLKLQSIELQNLNNFTPIILDETHCLRDQVISICNLSGRKDQSVQLKQGTLPLLMQLVDTEPSFTLLPQLALNAMTSQKIQKQTRLILNPVPTRKVSLVYHKAFVKKSLIEPLYESIRENLPEGLLTTRPTSKIKTFDPNQDHFS